MKPRDIYVKIFRNFSKDNAKLIRQLANSKSIDAPEWQYSYCSRNYFREPFKLEEVWDNLFEIKVPARSWRRPKIKKFSVEDIVIEAAYFKYLGEYSWHAIWRNDNIMWRALARSKSPNASYWQAKYLTEIKWRREIWEALKNNTSFEAQKNYAIYCYEIDCGEEYYREYVKAEIYKKVPPNHPPKWWIKQWFEGK